MTEAEWNICTDPQFMLIFLGNKISDRKIRLFLTGYSRSLWQLLHVDTREALETAERFADGCATIEELHQAEYRAGRHGNDEEDQVQDLREQAAAPGLSPDQEWDLLLQGADQCDRQKATAMAHAATIPELGTFIPVPMGFSGNHETAARVLLCIVGNPFRSVSLDLAWCTPTVTQLAQAIYEDRAFDRMPILADALEDAGCTDASVLEHCRGGSVHARGCWVVDLLLGKE